MANIKSAIKRAQIAKARTLKNAAEKSRLRTVIRRFEEALAESKETAMTKLQVAIRVIDKAAQKGIIHKNAAARKKSRLTRKFNKAS